ncbi:MAG TPA: hypothetical protein VN361_12760 [Oxalicibacterium sp.]|nr:hypothetical protein [Oxalicibacterium sp.]
MVTASVTVVLFCSDTGADGAATSDAGALRTGFAGTLSTTGAGWFKSMLVHAFRPQIAAAISTHLPIIFPDIPFSNDAIHR